MQIVQFVAHSCSRESLEDRDYQDRYQITEQVQIPPFSPNPESVIFRVADSEPEDSNLSRSFNDCFSVLDLMKKCYELGKQNISCTFGTREDL